MYAVWILLALSAAIASGSEWESLCSAGVKEPWGVDKIAPVVIVYSQKKSTTFTVTDMSQIPTQIAQLEKDGYFKVGRPVVFVTHGFWNNQLFLWLYDVKDGILKNDDSTVFITTWGGGAITPDYNQAAANTQVVGKVIAEMAENALKTKTFGGDPKNIYLHCIGHSLGGHVCGAAGRFSGHFNRVTGLDPAGPLFDTCMSNVAVNNQSAACVDHIHTDGTGKEHFDAIIPHYGTLGRWGHVDFYPNGGEAQSGCSILTNDITACSHMKAIDYFVFSLNHKNNCMAKPKCEGNKFNCLFKGIGAKKQQMGYFSSCYKGSKVMPGAFELSTGGTRPYC